MELIKNLDFIKLVKTVKEKHKSDTSQALKSGMQENNQKELSNISQQFIPLDYSRYNFNTKDLKFDRNEINERK